MGQQLYETEPTYRACIDRCSQLLLPRLGMDLRDVLLSRGDTARAERALEGIVVVLCALFSTEYALATLLMEWGVRPSLMLGHSMGEYVAATLAGTLELPDALGLIVERARLMGTVGAGEMMSARLPEAELLPLLPPELSLAAVNGPTHCVVSGPVEAVRGFRQVLAERGVEHQLLHLTSAGHSAMLDAILPAFIGYLRGVALHQPRIPFLSNVTGQPITDAQAVSPEYWARHLRQTVRFAEGLQHLLADPEMLLVEVGPGHGLTSLVRAQVPLERAQGVWNTIRHVYTQEPDDLVLAACVARLWLSGGEVDWGRLHGSGRRRVSLPTYPFERVRHWYTPPASREHPSREVSRRRDMADWFYVPSWKRTPLPRPDTRQGQHASWLVFCQDRTLAGAVSEALAREGRGSRTVSPGPEYRELDEHHVELVPSSPEHLRQLLQRLAERGEAPAHVLYLWPLERAVDGHTGYLSLVHLIQALEETRRGLPVRLTVAAEGLFDVSGQEALEPSQALLLGPCMVAPQEYPGLGVRCVDVSGVLATRGAAALSGLLVREAMATTAERMAAYRGERRWAQTYEPLRLESSPDQRPLRERGVYLLTGGFGRIGFWLAEQLATSCQARIVLVSRSPFPERGQWRELAATTSDEMLRRRLQKMLELEAKGALFQVEQADVADAQAMAGVLARAEAAFGRVDGILHAAGVTQSESSLSLLRDLDAQAVRRAAAEQFHAKVEGTRVLEQLLEGRAFDFCLLFSSNAAVLGGLGQCAYTAANAFLDAFAARRAQLGDSRWISATWDGWRFPGEEGRSTQSSLDVFALAPDESPEVFRRVVTQVDSPQVVVSKGELLARVAFWVHGEGLAAATPQARPEPAETEAGKLALEAESCTEVEHEMVRIWQAVMGIRSIQVHDNLFQLGGHSLLATQILSRIRERFQVSLPFRRLFEVPTVQGMAAAVQELLDAGRQESEPAPQATATVDILSLLQGLPETRPPSSEE
ncbi:MAG: SDR family NAD(P)-dependent oxidoreductase [Hyalangium sp.]|uniref:SDR family NAD(P)-dependent oxidoreductase n=1 Tax=Hyalangium sp. TaxID=2028555 RepID=UPI00389A4C93